MKISNLPKTGVSSKKDLLTVVQGGVTKTISKKDLLNSLESKVSSVVAEIKALKNNVSKKTISKDTPSFSKPITSPHPISNKHLTTKEEKFKKLSWWQPSSRDESVTNEAYVPELYVGLVSPRTLTLFKLISPSFPFLGCNKSAFILYIPAIENFNLNSEIWICFAKSELL